MKYYMIFSIGPVQDFIATARRSRDLWYGSWMLSELARFVAKEIIKDKDNKLIFPANSDIESVPNKIVAVVETNDPKTFAEDIKTATRNYLVETLANPTLKIIEDKIRETKSKPFNRTLADDQIKDLPEVYWVSVPYDKEYEDVREQAEALLVARKNTRDFEHIKGENRNVPKSSLDGSRESVIDEREYPNNRTDSDNEKADKVRKLYDIYNARQGERLSGVDLLKRLGEKGKIDEDNKNVQPYFKSTSHMAAIPFLEKLDTKWGKVKREEFIESIRQLFAKKGWNIRKEDEGALLYESRIADWIPAGIERAKQKKIREDYNKIWEDNGLKDSRPSSYYALLRADGDNMGKVIDEQKEEKNHQDFSKALSDFASQVKTIVNENNKGLLIYSGGDDVLAYLPINKALQCAKELEDTFRRKLSGFAFTKDKETIEPTLSIGIVIAHHLDPLSDVLQLARTAEHTAKDKVKGKNGLAVTLSKRSGIDRTIVGKFVDLYKRLNEMIDLTDQKIISGGTAYELQELQRALPDDFSLGGLKAEALRIVKHKQSAEGKKLSEKDKERYVKIVDGWLKQISTSKKDSKAFSLSNVANEMIIAKALADGAEPAKGQEKEVQNESETNHPA